MIKFEYSDRRQQLSLSENINQAINAIAEIQDRTSEPSEWGKVAAQSGRYSKPTLKLIDFLGKNHWSKFAISELLNRYASIASNEAGVNQILLFEDGIRSKNSILDEAIDYVDSIYDNDEDSESYDQKIARDSEAWSNTVDRFMSGELRRSRDGNLLHVMDTPSVFTLVGMERLPIEIRIDNLHKILLKKHHISPETLKPIHQKVEAALKND